MDEQIVIDKLIDYIDKAILKNSVSNRHVAAVLAFLNEKLKSKKIDIEELKKIFLLSTEEDTAEKIITFLGGFLIGENGSGITVLPDGTSQAVVDRLYVKIKAVFDELETKKKTHVGGEQVISPAGMKCIKVEELAAAYRCYFKASEDGVEIKNEFTVGQLAISQECNIKPGISPNTGNRFYWRLVSKVGDDYIDLSKTDCYTGSNVPQAGDDIVGFGHQSDITRQGAIVMSSTNEVAPSIIMYQGINDFTYAGKEVISFDYDKATGKARMKVYGDAYIGAKDHSSYVELIDDKVNIKAKLDILPGSKGFENVDGLEFGKVNLLRNSGFTGDYNSAKLEEDTLLTDDTELYNQAFKWWTATNVTVNYDDSLSLSGRSATLHLGVLTQTLYYKLYKGERYVLSFKAKGSSVSVNVGGFEQTQTLTPEYDRYIFKFEASQTDTDISFSGTCTITELQLERGTVLSVWSMSPLDNNSFETKFEALRYLTDAIREGSSSFIGGLGLLSTILVGNYADGEMKKVTGGLSGTYNDDDDVLLWGGGNLEKAINAVNACKDNPQAILSMSEEELATIAKIVLTHGGKAILNDVVMRGYIYALGGVFKGNVEIAGGKILLKEDGSGQLANGALFWDRTGTLYRKSREIIVWRNVFDEMITTGTTDIYNIDLSKGTFLFTVGDNHALLNLPSPTDYPELTLDIKDPPRTRVPISFMTIKCETSPILKSNPDTNNYEETMIGEPRGGDGTIYSTMFGGEYRWIASTNLGSVTFNE